MIISTQTSVDRWQAMFQSGLFGMAFVMAKEVEFSSMTVVLTAIIDFAQMLAFPLNSSPLYPWNAPGNTGTFVASLSRVLSYITPDTLDQVHSERTFVTVFVIAMLWTAVYVALAGCVAWSFSQSKPQMALVLRALRSVAWLSSTVLFLPFTSVLMRGLACPNAGDWMGTGMTCWEGGHLALTLLQALLLPCFIGLSLFIASVFINRDVQRPTVDSKVDGRVDVAMLTIKVVLTAVYNIPDSEVMQSWAVVLLVLMTGVAWPVLMQLHRPFITPAMTDLQTGLGTAYLWACTVLVFAKLGRPGTDYSVAVLGGMVATLVAGAAVSHVRQQRTQARPLNKLRSVYDFHVWATMKLEQARRLEVMDESAMREAAEGRLGSLPLLCPAPSQADEEDAMVDMEEGERAGVDGLTGGERGRGRRSNRVAPAPNEEALPRSSRQAQHGVPYKAHVLAGLRAQAELAYVEMVRHHPHSAMAHVIAAQFFRHFHDNKYMEMATLNKARGMSAALDVRFFVHQRTLQLREEADGDRSGDDAQLRRVGLSPIDRVLFDQQWVECRQLYKTAYRQMLALWDTLKDMVPDLVDIQRAGSELQHVLERMHQLYASMLSINPESTAVLRSYADFLLTLAGDQAKAMEAVNKADRLDEVHAKQHSKAVQHVVLGSLVSEQLSVMDDKAATVTFSGDAASLGEILSVSNAATVVFGYTKLQLVGQHFGTLLPPPLRAAMGTMLRQFARTGRGALFGTTRVMLGHAKAGHIFPMYLTLREAPPCRDSLAPRFVAVMRLVQTSENLLLVSDAHAMFRVHAGCPRSLEMLGLDAEALAAKAVPGTQVFPALAGHYSEQIQVEVGRAHAVAESPAARRATTANRRNTLTHMRSMMGSTSTDESTLGPRKVILMLRALMLDAGQQEQVTALRAGFGGQAFARVRVQPIRMPVPEPAFLLAWRPVRMDVAALQRSLPANDPRSLPGGSTVTVDASSVAGAWVASSLSDLEDDNITSAGTMTAAPLVAVPARRTAPVPTVDMVHRVVVPTGDEGEEEESDSKVHGSEPEAAEASCSAARPGIAGVGSMVTKDGDAGSSTCVASPPLLTLMEEGSSVLMPMPPAGPVGGAGAAAAAKVGTVALGSTGQRTPAPKAGVPKSPTESASMRRQRRRRRAARAGYAASSDEESPTRTTVARRHRKRYAVHPAMDELGTDTRSDGHSSDHSSKATSLSRLRRTLQAMQKRVEPEVRVMQRGLAFNVAAVILIAVLVGVGFRWQRDRMMVQYQSVRDRTDRLVRLQQSITSLRIAESVALGLTALGDVREHAQQFALQMEHFDALHRSVTAMNEEVGASSLELDERRSIVIEEPRSGREPLRYNMTLPEAGSHMVTLARTIMRGFGPSTPDTFWLAFPAVQTFQLNYAAVERAMEAAVYAAQLDFVLLSEEMNQLKILVFVAIFTVTLAVSATLYVRSIRSLKRRANSILLLFLRIPRPVIKVARDLAMLRYEASMMEELEAEEAEAADADRRDAAAIGHARSVRLGDASPVRRGPPAMEHEDTEGVDWQQVFARGQAVQQTERGQRYRDSSKFVLRATVLTLLPLLAVAMWGLGIHFGQAVSVHDSIDAARRMMLAQLQVVDANDLITTSYDLYESATPATRIAYQDRMDRIARRLSSRVGLLLHGGVVPSAHDEYGVSFEIHELHELPEQTEAVQVLLHDACRAMENQSRCAAAFEGVFLNGAAAAMLSFATLTRSVAFAIDPYANETVITPAMLQDLVNMLHMENPYLRQMFNVTAVSFFELAGHDFEAGVDIQVAVAVVFVLPFTLAMLLFSRPLTGKLADELRSARSLLLVIPEQVVQHVPSLRDGVQQVLMKGEVEAAEGAHHGSFFMRRAR